jgi:hypothetical protein
MGAASIDAAPFLLPFFVYERASEISRTFRQCFKSDPTAVEQLFLW